MCEQRTFVRYGVGMTVNREQTMLRHHQQTVEGRLLGILAALIGVNLILLAILLQLR